MALRLTSFKGIVILSKNVEKTAGFYSEVVGLKLVHSTGKFAELTAKNPGVSIMIKHAPTLAHATTGFSPILAFEVPRNLQVNAEQNAADFEEVIEKAKKQFDCEIDGQIE